MTDCRSSPPQPPQPPQPPLQMPTLGMDPRRAPTIPGTHFMVITFEALEQVRRARFWWGFALGFVAALFFSTAMAWLVP